MSAYVHAGGKSHLTDLDVEEVARRLNLFASHEFVVFPYVRGWDGRSMPFAVSPRSVTSIERI